MSESINELAAALAKAQGAFAVPKKSHRATVPTKSGGNYTYTYSTLEELIEATRPALAANGLAALFDVTTDGAFVRVSTFLTHSSGQWLQTDPIALPSGGTPQGVGSAATYGRRYSLSGALNVAAEDDDDAQQAQAGTAKAKPQAVKPPTPKPDDGLTHLAPISEAQRKRLFAIAKEHGWSHPEVAKLLKDRFNVDSSDKVTTYRYDELIDCLKSGVDAMANTQESKAS